MIDYVKNSLIGLFVAVACSLIVGIVLFLEPSVGDGKKSLIVRFSNINGLSIGTRVMFAGKPIGEVVAITQIPRAREQPTDLLGQVYFYQLLLHVDSTVNLYSTDEITVQTSGLLGEKSIAIIPHSSPRGVEPVLITDQIPVYAESVDPLESALENLTALSSKAEETLNKVMDWIDQNGHALGLAIRSFDSTMQNASHMLNEVNRLGLIKQIYSSVTYFKQTMHSASSIAAQIASGEGSVGELLYSNDTYLRVKAILSKIDILMNDVNHYGVFFNLNKQWQRTRIKQIRLMDALQTPQEFINYFNKEIDLIGTTMARLSMLIEQASYQEATNGLFRAPGFENQFIDLLNRSRELSEALELYNRSILDLQDPTTNCPK